jgi:hypothetical protein
MPLPPRKEQELVVTPDAQDYYAAYHEYSAWVETTRPHHTADDSVRTPWIEEMRRRLHELEHSYWHALQEALRHMDHNVARSLVLCPECDKGHCLVNRPMIGGMFVTDWKRWQRGDRKHPEYKLRTWARETPWEKIVIDPWERGHLVDLIHWARGLHDGRDAYPKTMIEMDLDEYGCVKRYRTVVYPRGTAKAPLLGEWSDKSK